MIEHTIQIQNKMGLHARPAARMVKITSKFSSRILFTKDGMTINAKSILGVMSLAAERGSKILIKIDGDDEKEALDRILELFQQIYDDDN
ncbi:MAG: HPr family phosphocarrier protein [bacterium]|nr:HPr family phosphocarrier protein [bacterium]